MKDVKLEVCCGNINDVLAIQGLDYDRIELNSALELGGLTPSIATLKAAKRLTDKPICCMVRTRGAGFTYSKAEIDVMKKDAELLIENGADGIVFGFLDESGKIDVDALKEMREITKGKDLVFHKAFDLIEDKEEAIAILIASGVDRILLMNENNEDFEEALVRIGNYQTKYGDKIQLLPGGGITEDNILHVLSITGTTQIHGTFKEVIDDGVGSYVTVSRKRVGNVIKILEEGC